MTSQKLFCDLQLFFSPPFLHVPVQHMQLVADSLLEGRRIQRFKALLSYA